MYKPILLLVLGLSLRAAPARAQSAELRQLILDISKLSVMKSTLQDMYKYFTILDQGYEGVKNLSKGNFNLHEVFLDALLIVSPNVSADQRIADIISAQIAIVQEYESALKTFRADPHFTAAEITYMAAVYTNLLAESIKDLDELTMVLTDGTLRMSDDERLSVIDRVHRSMLDKLAFLRHFNNAVALQSAQRGRPAGDLSTLKTLYGL